MMPLTLRSVEKIVRNVPVFWQNVKGLSGDDWIVLSKLSKGSSKYRQWWHAALRVRDQLTARLAVIETEKKKVMNTELAKLEKLNSEEMKKIAQRFLLDFVIETVEVAYTAGWKYPLRVLSLDVSPVNMPVDLCKSTMTRTLDYSKTVRQLVVKQRWALREQPIDEISSSAKIILDNLNIILSNLSESLVQRVDIGRIENRRIRLFLANPPRIDSRFLSSGEFKSLLRILGGGVNVAQQTWQYVTGNTIFQRAMKAEQSLQIMEGGGMLPFTTGESFLLNARAFHQSFWLQSGQRCLFLLGGAFNLFDIMHSLYRHPQVVEGVQSAIMSSFGGAPWPSSSLSNRCGAYQSVMGLLGRGDERTTLENMLTHMIYNFSIHAAACAGNVVFEPITKFLYFLYQSHRGYRTLDYYPDWTPDVSVYANPDANDALHYFMNKLLMETVVIPVAGAFMQGFGVALVRHRIQKVIDSPAFIHALRESIDGFLRALLFNPEELLEFELGGALMQRSEHSAANQNHFGLVTDLLSLVLRGLGFNSSPAPTLSLIQQFERNVLSIPTQFVTQLKHHPRPEFRNYAYSDPMSHTWCEIDDLLDHTPISTRGRKQCSWAELPGLVVVTSVSFVTGLFVSTERLLKKRISSAQSVEELPSEKELDAFERQCKKSLCRTYRSTARVAQMRKDCQDKALELATVQAKTRQETLRLYGEYKALSSQVDKARGSAELPSARVCQDIKTQLLALKSAAGSNAKGLVYIGLIEKIFSVDLSDKRQLKHDELIQDWSVQVMTQFTAENMAAQGRRPIQDLLATCVVKEHPLFASMMMELGDVLEKPLDEVLTRVGKLPHHAITLNDISTMIERENFEAINPSMIEHLKLMLKDLNGQAHPCMFEKCAIDGLKRKASRLFIRAAELNDLHEDVSIRLRNIRDTLSASLETETVQTLRAALVKLSDILDKVEGTPGLYAVIARELNLTGDTHDHTSIMEDFKKRCDAELERNFQMNIEKKFEYLKSKSRYSIWFDTSPQQFEEQKKALLRELEQLPFVSMGAGAIKARLSERIQRVELLDSASPSEARKSN